MITYYIIGNWMGIFRTVSTTETIEKFKQWAKLYEVSKQSDGQWRHKDGYPKVVIESLQGEL